MINNVIFVTGTDTGVGKTVVTALLALKVRQIGFSCGVLKPFASGCDWKNGVLVSEDAEFVKNALNLPETLGEICPIRLEEPLAPLIAARRAGLPSHVWPETARAALENLKSRYRWVVVEGAGGLLAPLWEKNGKIGSNLDLINEWGVPSVVVTRRSLGTINHTLLTLQTPLETPAHFAGLVVNDSAPVSADDVASEIAVDYLRQVLRVPLVGVVPFLPKPDATSLNRIAATLHLDLK